MTVATVAAAPSRRSIRSVPDARSAPSIYEGSVAHRRLGPDAREFAPKLFLAHLDVDALPGSLDPFPLWSARRAAPVRFRRRDFFDGGTRPLGDAVRDLVAARLGWRPLGSVTLLAHLRTFGWLFNPLAVYYCWAADGDGLDAIVLEVTSTPWRERHWYVFDARHASSARTPKALHVSPFLPMDLDYAITWTVPGPDLSLRIQAERNETLVFEAELTLRQTHLSRHRAISVLARHPLLPLRVSAGIYRQALQLLARRVPRHRHPAPRAQKGKP